MSLEELRENWNGFGEADPLFSILTLPNKAGRKWDQESFFALGRVEVEAILERVAAQGVPLRGGRALDFGCGVGRLSQALAERFQVDGIDIAPSMVRLAHAYNRHGERCRYWANESSDLSRFADGSFDFILSIAVLLHMKPRYARRYLQEFLRLLAPGGVLVFGLPEPGFGIEEETWISRVREVLRSSLPPRLRHAIRRLQGVSGPWMELHGMQRKDVTAWLAAHGGRVIDAWDDVPWIRQLVAKNEARLCGLTEADFQKDHGNRPFSPRYCVIKAA